MFEKFYQLQQDVLDTEELNRVLVNTSNSPLLGENLLSKAFVGTRGFSVIWKKGLRAEQNFSASYAWLSKYLKHVIKPETNAWYLNGLVITQGGDIAPHKDQSLEPYLKKTIHPTWVSVLCLQAPTKHSGGALELYWEGVKLTTISPIQNQLTHFVGDLDHLVTEYKAEEPRVTLVCEQYTLSDELLGFVPEWTELSHTDSPYQKS